MTCWVEVVRWGLSSSSRSEAVWEWIQDSMGCQFVEELRFVSASRPPPRLRQQHQQLLTKFHFRITPVIHLPLFSILRLNTPKPNPNVILCAHRVSILSITKFFSPHPLMSAWSGQVRVDIQLISWNAFCYSQLRRLTGSNLLTFFLTYLLTFFLTYLSPFFLTYLQAFFLTYLLIFFLTSFWHIFSHSFWHIFWHIFWHSFWHIFWHAFWHIFWHSFWHIKNQNLTSTVSQKKKQLCKLYIYLTPRNKSNIHDNFVPVKCHRPHCIGPPRQKAAKSKDAKRL